MEPLESRFFVQAYGKVIGENCQTMQKQGLEHEEKVLQTFRHSPGCHIETSINRIEGPRSTWTLENIPSNAKLKVETHVATGTKNINFELKLKKFPKSALNVRI